MSKASTQLYLPLVPLSFPTHHFSQQFSSFVFCLLIVLSLGTCCQLPSSDGSPPPLCTSQCCVTIMKYLRQLTYKEKVSVAHSFEGSMSKMRLRVGIDMASGKVGRWQHVKAGACIRTNGHIWKQNRERGQVESHSPLQGHPQ
jgi:hypothetical protein